MCLPCTGELKCVGHYCVALCLSLSSTGETDHVLVLRVCGCVCLAQVSSNVCWSSVCHYEALCLSLSALQWPEYVRVGLKCEYVCLAQARISMCLAQVKISMCWS